MDVEKRVRGREARQSGEELGSWFSAKMGIRVDHVPRGLLLYSNEWTGEYGSAGGTLRRSFAGSRSGR